MQPVGFEPTIPAGERPQTARPLRPIPPGLTFTDSTFCPHIVFLCFVWISEQTAIVSLYNINWLVFVTETESVYCAVRTEHLNVVRFSLNRQMVTVRSLVDKYQRLHYRACLIALLMHLCWTRNELKEVLVKGRTALLPNLFQFSTYSTSYCDPSHST